MREGGEKKVLEIPLLTFSHVLYFLDFLVAAIKGAFHVIISFSNLSKPGPFPCFPVLAQLSLLPAKVIFLYYTVTLHSHGVQSYRPYMSMKPPLKSLESLTCKNRGFRGPVTELIL